MQLRLTMKSFSTVSKLKTDGNRNSLFEQEELSALFSYFTERKSTTGSFRSTACY